MSKNKNLLNKEQKQILLTVAKETIRSRLNNETIPKFNFCDKIFAERRGAFVTVHKNGNLRGCIGYIEGIKPIIQTIKNMAISAAFNDPRFPSLQKKEFPKLNIEISILTPLVKVNNVKNIEIGRDGLIIKQGFRQGLLLPQVATENNWNVDEFLQNTCLKAGLPLTAWKDSATDIKKFSAQVFDADVAEILDMDEVRNRFSSHMRE